MLSLLLATAMATQPSTAWHDRILWQGREARMTITSKGGYVLHAPERTRAIPAPASRVDTASVLFDGLYAMAQDDLKQDSVTAIHDDAFDHGQAISCHCFETGAKWHYVWTRDLSYALDLGLWRFDRKRARHSLLFKLSDVRNADMQPGLYPMQDTGSGGSWPISTDRVVWFLGARHLLDHAPFADKVWRALKDTLAQDRRNVFDARMGLYRGETSFLDWRQQSYPAWTADNVTFIAQSFALSTNVLHYEALRLAARMADQRHLPEAAERYKAQAQALKASINKHFWRTDRGLYMSYIGGNGLPVEAYDLLGLSLAIDSGVADPQRARRILAQYPVWPAGSPVIWPERADQPIYHNRAIWPFVSAYALRAARKARVPALMAREVQSLVRGAALAASNMENFSLLSQKTHVEDGKLSGPVVDSPRQLWSVAGYLDMVVHGVFGLGADGHVQPVLPTSLVPMLFGKRDRITLTLHGRSITLIRPVHMGAGNLLVADSRQRHGQTLVVHLKAISVTPLPLRSHAPLYAPATPPAPAIRREGSHWRVQATDADTLYVDGQRIGALKHGSMLLPAGPALPCVRVTRHGSHGLESLPSVQICAGSAATLAGSWPRQWSAPSSGIWQVALRYDNPHGPINTGITAAVRRLTIQCAGAPVQTAVLVLPHSDGEQFSTAGRFHAQAGQHCQFSLHHGPNMSDLTNFAHYTGGTGGASGPLNAADMGALRIRYVGKDNNKP